MTDWLLELVPQYGFWLLALTTFGSCLALPLPASILMLTAGGFVASEDLTFLGSIGGALSGAVAGDITGYVAGRLGGAALMDRLGRKVPAVGKASDFLARRGSLAVFLSRWLFSALGPYVNVAAGAARQPWPRFMAAEIAGEAVWVGVYVYVGYVFTGNIAAASSMVLDVLGIFAAGTLALGLGYWLLSIIRSERRPQGGDGDAI